MPTKEQFLEAFKEIRKQEEGKGKESQRKFNQSADLIINLREFDLKKTPLSLFVTLPNKTLDKKIAGFFEKKSNVVETITKENFDTFKEKKKLKKLVDSYDFFIASAKLMPAVASNFGRALGPAGKMPSPQMGVVMVEDEKAIKALAEKVSSVVKIRPKEPSVKVAIGKASSDDEKLAENAFAVFNEVFKVLPRSKENLRSVLVKYTMGKPAKVKM